MITDEGLRGLVTDLESDRIERTTSTTDTAKFCEAICAFANDMPGHRTPGYLVLGARDEDGAIDGVNMTDDLLKKISNYADSGQIVPLPSLTVRECTLDGRGLVVAEVLPSDMPPIRYRGRV